MVEVWTMVNGPNWPFFTRRICCTAGTKWESFETEMLGCTSSGELHSARDEDFTASLFYAFTFVASSFTLPGGGFLISSRARLTMSTCGDLVDRMTEGGELLANLDTSSSSSFSNSFTERGTHGVLGGECFGS